MNKTLTLITQALGLLKEAHANEMSRARPANATEIEEFAEDLASLMGHIVRVDRIVPQTPEAAQAQSASLS